MPPPTSQLLALALASARRGGALAAVVLAHGAPAAAAWVAAHALAIVRLLRALLAAAVTRAPSGDRAAVAARALARMVRPVLAATSRVVPRLSLAGDGDDVSGRSRGRRGVAVDMLGGWVRCAGMGVA